MQRILLKVSAVFLLLLGAAPCDATVFGTVRVIVHDPQHRPVQGAAVRVKAAASSWTQTEATNDEGIAEFSTVPAGDYQVSVAAKSFAAESQPVTAISGRLQESHFQLRPATVEHNITVTAETTAVNPTSSTPQQSADRTEIARTPGAERANSLSFITDFTPGAVVVHDQLHVRGGHQVTWALDGVALPNTNIGSNVGPQFDPKDVEYMEQQRGAYSAEFGDRTYGVFNIVPRSGFERNRLAELTMSYGSFHLTDDQLSFGDHSERSAYYLSLAGNRSDYGLETPTDEQLHDQAAGGSVFASAQSNLSARDQLRLAAGFRGDYYQIPNGPAGQAAGVRDRQREQDGFAVFTWARTLDARTLFTLSPFVHFNRAAFEGSPADVPIANDNRASTYAGGQAALSGTRRQHSFRAGIYAFAQHDEHRFSVLANDGSGGALSQRIRPNGALEAVFLDDQYRARPWLTLNAGVRLSHFAGGVNENSADPRLGAAITLPRIGWVLRAAYSRFYQPPPLDTVSGPLLSLAAQQGFGFLPLKGERDEQHNFGVTVPLRGWAADVDYFRAGARNFFDHDVLENSAIFFPLTIDHVRVRGVEVAARSPRLLGRMRARLAYSRQAVEGSGGVTGGLTDFSPPDRGLFFLDHDQRHT